MTDQPDHPIYSKSHLSDDELKEILSNPDHPSFHEYAAKLLENTLDFERVREYIEPELLAEEYDRIQREFSNKNTNNNRMARKNWDETISILREKFDIEKTDKSRSSKSKPDPSSLAYRLRSYRTEKGMTQQEIAEKINVSRQTISSFESGAHELSRDSLRRYADALGYGVNIILEPKSDLLMSYYGCMDRAFMELTQAYDFSSEQIQLIQSFGNELGEMAARNSLYDDPDELIHDLKSFINEFEAIDSLKPILPDELFESLQNHDSIDLEILNGLLDRAHQRALELQSDSSTANRQM